MPKLRCHNRLVLLLLLCACSEPRNSSLEPEPLPRGPDAQPAGGSGDAGTAPMAPAVTDSSAPVVGPSDAKSSPMPDAAAVQDASPSPDLAPPVDVAVDKPPVVVPPPPPTDPGAVIWRVKTPGSANALAVDGSGNIFVGATSSSDDVLLAKLSPDGQELWRHSIEGPGRQDVSALALAADGTLGVAGSFAGATDFGGQTRTDVGNADGFVAFFNPMGDLKNVVTFGSTSQDGGFSIAADPSGDWFVGGQAQGVVMAGTTITSGFVSRFDRVGKPVWTKTNGGFGMAAFPNALFTGTFNAPQIALLGTSNGSTTWAKSLGDSVEVRGIAREPNGKRLLITGNFGGTLNLNGRTLTSTDNVDIFVAGLDAATGQPLWGEALSSQGFDYGTGACSDAEGNGYVTGAYSGSDQFQSGEPEGSQQAYVAKYRFDGTREWRKIIPGGFGFSIVCDSPRGILVGLNFELARVVP
jgi:hypothetical protein